MAADEQLNKEYLPITGEDSFVVAGMKLVLGAESPLISSRKVLVPRINCIYFRLMDAKRWVVLVLFILHYSFSFG